jgi:hypothetical protein
MRVPPPPPTDDRRSDVGIKIGIKRFGNSVQIDLQCNGDYHAVELYDRLVNAAEDGEVRIDLKTGQASKESSS